MANSDSTTLENLKTTRDAILSDIAAGRTTIEYRIGNRLHRNADPTAALMAIEELIDAYTKKVNRRSKSPYRPVRLVGVSRRNST